jgi:acyl transferase domain-containing protein
VILGKGTYLNRGNLGVVQHGRIVEQTLEILRTLHPEYTESDFRMIRAELKQGLPPFGADTAPGLIPNIIAGRIANRLDLMGPSYTVDGACASSLLAVEIAVRGLRNREYDLALVGGAHVATPVPVLMLFCQLGALSRREQIRPFDRDADGTILGEGIGMITLKRLADAERDGDRMYAVIKEVGVSSDGRGLSVTAPRVEGEVLALHRAYEKAGISPSTIGLMEAHGTGTPVGDAAEIEALSRVFGPRSSASPWCALGSVKSMIGHLMPAAGIASLIKAALAVYHKVLPPTLNVGEPTPALESQTPFYLNTETRPWIHSARDMPRRAGVNAFGFGGINAHVVLEEYRLADDTAFQSRHLHWDTEVCILSSGSRTGLIQRAQELQYFLQTGPQVHLKDLAYTLNVTLDEGRYRLAIVASALEDLRQKLDGALERLSDPACRQIKNVQGIYFFEQPLATSGQLALIFPGEGSQYINMLADLCLHFPEVREQFDAIDRVFANHGREYVPSDFIFPHPTFSSAERRAAEERLWRMEGAVEAVLTASRALSTLLGRLEVHPDAVVGHSTGEYSAMLASGMIDLADETLVGRFTMELNQIHRQVAAEGGIPHAALVAVGADADTVSAVIEPIDGDIYVAMDNCPHQAVVVGAEDAVEQAVEELRRRGLIYERLPFDRPYHTPMFEAFAARLRPLFAQWLVAPPRVRTYSCTTMSSLSDLAQIQEVAVEHWLRPVEFRKTIEAMYADGVRIFVEAGPRGNLTAFVDDILRGQPHLAVPADVINRSSIAQLNHLVGMLAAQGVPMQLDYLYSRRSPRKLDLDRPDDPEGRGQKSSDRVKLATGWPPMVLSEETALRLRFRDRSTSPASASPDARTQPLDALTATPTSHGAPSLTEPDMDRFRSGSASGLTVHPTKASSSEGVPEAARTAGSLHESQARASAASEVMSAHLQTMERFLAVEQEVMQAFLAGRRVTPSAYRTAVPPTSSTGTSEAQSASQEVSSPASVETHQAPASSVSATEGGAASLAQASPSREGHGVPQPSLAEASRLSRQTVDSTLLQLVSERTGYPVEMLDLNLDLEADLGIDSIKRVEILGSLQQQMGSLQAVDMEALAGCKTLQEVIDVQCPSSTLWCPSRQARNSTHAARSTWMRTSFYGTTPLAARSL